MDPQKKRQLVAGGTLIVIGLALFLAEYLQDFGYTAIIIVIGALFLAGYLYSRTYGFLVPGCILLGVGAGSFGEKNFDLTSDFAQISIGAGFIAIFVIALIVERRSHWWPLIPGTILVLFGFNRWNATLEYMLERGWPLILVAIGLLIFVGSLLKKRSKPEEPPREPKS